MQRRRFVMTKTMTIRLDDVSRAMSAVRFAAPTHCTANSASETARTPTPEMQDATLEARIAPGRKGYGKGESGWVVEDVVMFLSRPDWNKGGSSSFDVRVDRAVASTLPSALRAGPVYMWYRAVVVSKVWMVCRVGGQGGRSSWRHSEQSLG
jgi:hypothetical protein